MSLFNRHTGMIVLWLTMFLGTVAAENVQKKSGALSEPISAQALLTHVRASIPKETLLIKGKLMKGKRIGRLEQASLFEALLKWGQTPPTACFTLSDAFGTPFSRLTIIRPINQSPKFLYEQGQPLQHAPTPDLNHFIEDTVITWNDLSLSFLWWPNGHMAEQDNIRGRDCYVIEIPAAPPYASAVTAISKTSPRTSPVDSTDVTASIRLWIDNHLIVLIQMEAYNAEGKLLRRLSVKNFKKIGDRWMIKNMNIRRYPSRYQTQIRINSVLSMSSNTPNMNLDK